MNKYILCLFFLMLTVACTPSSPKEESHLIYTSPPELAGKTWARIRYYPDQTPQYQEFWKYGLGESSDSARQIITNLPDGKLQKREEWHWGKTTDYESFTPTYDKNGLELSSCFIRQEGKNPPDSSLLYYQHDSLQGRLIASRIYLEKENPQSLAGRFTYSYDSTQVHWKVQSQYLMDGDSMLLRERRYFNPEGKEVLVETLSGRFTTDSYWKEWVWDKKQLIQESYRMDTFPVWERRYTYDEQNRWLGMTFEDIRREISYSAKVE